MRGFEHINAASVDEAVAALRQYSGNAKVIAGGTDLISALRGGIYPHPPQAVINLKSIPELHGISEQGDIVTIGAAVTLTELLQSVLIREKLPLLALAASKTASRLLRNSGTLAGNICQENRCWYYRYPDQLGGQMECIRKGGRKCFAVAGESRYHSIFGAVKRCIAVNPGDTAPALIVLDATVQTDQRRLPIREFFSAENGAKSTVLAGDEVVVGLSISVPSDNTRVSFQKFALRKTIDFPIVNCAVAVTMDGDVAAQASIVLNAVHCNPYRATEGEAFLGGQKLTPETAAKAADAAMAKARPLRANKYKVQIAKTLINDALLSALSNK